MTPIEKNIFVVDEQGNEYEATYPKRAKGLVKNGRARFISENTICLACPPSEYLEDNKMSENKTLVTANEATETTENIALIGSLEYVLKQMELVAKDTAYLNNTIAELGKITSSAGDIGASEKAQALGQVVNSREETNRKLIEFYQKMYDDVKVVKLSPSESLKQKALDMVIDMINKTQDMDVDRFGDILDTIRHLS